MEHSTHHVAHSHAQEHHHTHVIEHQHPEHYAYYKSKKFLIVMLAAVVLIAGLVMAGEKGLLKSLLFSSGATIKSVTIESVTPASQEVGRVKITNANGLPVSFSSLRLEDGGAYAKGADYKLIISEANSEDYLSVIGQTEQNGSLDFRLNVNVVVPAKSYKYLIIQLVNPDMIPPTTKYDFKVTAVGELGIK
jgi:hypothetical protein